MKAIKKILGVVWMLMAPAFIFLMLRQAVIKIGTASGHLQTNLILQWTIILLIFIPICIGFFIFGYYSVRGEYDRLP